MEKSITLIIITIFLTTAYAADNKIDYSFYDDKIEKVVLKKVCEGVEDGGECRFPSIMQGRLHGLCCGGICKRDVNSCDEKEPPNIVSLISIIRKLLCVDKRENDDCVIQREVTGEELRGKCCGGECIFGIRNCDELKAGEPTAKGPEMETDDLLKSLETLSCLGIPDGDRCQIPEHIAKEFNLFGVCCDEKCSFRTTTCSPNIIKEDESESMKNLLQIALVALIAVIAFILLILLVYKLLKKDKACGTPPPPDYSLELNRLNNEKRSLEEMIKLAHIKFNKRKLDGESFREIVRDHQKKLIEIETQINNLGKRVDEIEKKNKIN